ncbi:GTP cyclohydrolase II [Paenibacillus athensensis]|uniref:GTP cyclohydrolase II domain-containing protein n=1 Tax=Paenibacillus athensensis TaxID=1967502 RepID=A0A4Y8QAB1_9BACL|nr:GTP cyclohydrolase II [Paenibacillus athensensis]MCD1258888.1 GTP cyclohydrolase II [Paenibacillus athensensis]
MREIYTGGMAVSNDHLRITNVAKGILNTSYGAFSLYCFSMINDFEHQGRVTEHLALVKGEDKGWVGPVYYRLNSSCITSEVFGCERCDCKWQLDKAIEYIAEKGRGIITYHTSHEGRGFGLAAKLESYNLMDLGIRSSESYIQLGLGTEDRRDFRVGSKILQYFGVNEVILLGNNKKKLDALENAGISVVQRKSLIYDGNQEKVKMYLRHKAHDPEQDLLKVIGGGSY